VDKCPDKPLGANLAQARRPFVLTIEAHCGWSLPGARQAAASKPGTSLGRREKMGERLSTITNDPTSEERGWGPWGKQAAAGRVHGGSIGTI